MTTQEINHIHCAIMLIQTATDVDPWAMIIAVEAMEKQIPKKPKPKESTYVIPCSSCGEDISSKPNYCPKCGQRIDWSDEDDESGSD